MSSPPDTDPEPPDDTDPLDPTDPGDPGGPVDDDDTEDPDAPLGPPYDLRVVNAAEGGWSISVQWEFNFRYTEIAAFSVSRLKQGTTDWVVVASDLRNFVRTYTDMIPDNDLYTYVVTAHPYDGSPDLVSDPPLDENGNVVYIQADIATTLPQNIRKPLRSTKEKMFVAWNYHPSASSYMLEAIGDDDVPYYSVWVTDAFAPYGLFVGPHPSDMITVRVTVMRRHPDGSEYPASSAQVEFFVDDITDPHFGVIDIAGQDANTLLNRNLAFSAVVALAEYGTETAQLTVNGVVYEDVWIDHDGHWSATVETCYPAGSAVTAAMRIAAPDNLQDPDGS